MQTLSYLRGAAPAGLLPCLISVLGVSAILCLLLNGYNDYRQRLSEALNNETLATQKLSVAARVDNDLNQLQKNLSNLFKPRHSPPSLTQQQANSQRYALTEGHSTDSFYLSCPPAQLAARVVGLLSSDNIHKNMAVIDYRGTGASYSVADSLDKGINIVRIFPDRVIVNEHGYCAALLMN